MQVGIIGYGRFGKVLEQILAEDFTIRVFDSAGDSPHSLEETLSSEVVFYCVPISHFKSALKEHLEFFTSGSAPKLIVDVLSVKTYPKKIFEELLPETQQVLLTHPMFGPDSVKEAGLNGQPIVLDKFRTSDENYKFWKDYFTKTGLTPIEMRAEEHDKLAANSQGVAHFVGRVLDEFGMQPTPIDTLGAKKLLEIKEQTCNDTWELFTDLQTKNPYTIDMRVRLGEAVHEIYRKLLPNRINTEKLVVGIQGGKGSFNEEAARYYLSRNNIEDFEIQYLYTTANVLQALHEGKIDRGQFAIHNSTGGIVQETVEASCKHRYEIVEQFSIKIAHALMTTKGAPLEEVTKIMTHPQVLKQCKNNLDEKYVRLERTSGEGELIDHSNVAKHLSEGKLPSSVATMGSKVLAEIYDLRIVEDNLQDLENNFTSFLWVERP